MVNRSKKLGFGQRIRALESDFKSLDKTQNQLAISLGVSARTIRRWKHKEKAPAGRTKFRPEKLAKRERYYEQRIKEVIPAAREVKPLIPITEVDSGILDRPIFAFSLTEEINSSIELKAAILSRDKITIDFVYESMEGYANSFERSVTVKVKGRELTEILRDVYRFIRDEIPVKDSDYVITITRIY